MAETVNQENNSDTNQGGTGTENQAKTFTQEEVNRMISERVSREKAKYADYDQLKDKAGKYDQAIESGKSDLQKVTERAEKAERELDTMKKEKAAKEVRDKVAKEMDISADLLTGEDEETCKAQAKAMLEYFKPGSYPDVKDSGEANNTGKHTAADDFAAWFNKVI